jgi:uncharacterized SAM-binding protein YcdF (DUF218 family)
MTNFRTYIVAPLFVLAKFALFGAIISVAYFFASLQHFVLNLPKTSDSAHPNTDGIVVITGGQQRLSNGLHLLETGAGKALLVSGVGKGISKAILASELKLEASARELLQCCVTLEFQAYDTRGNAFAAAEWAKSNNFQSLRLVTANYHMPRAKYVFSNQMPHMNLHFWPFSPSELTLETWWKDPEIIRLLTREYAKYLTEPLRI